MRPELWIATALLLAACHQRADSEPRPAPKRARCAPAEAATAKEHIEVRGNVQPPPNLDAQVAPQVSGRLLRVDVREGDRVKAGAALARVDDAPLVDSLRQAEAAVVRARADRENAETTLARIEKVFDRGIAPKQEVDDAVARQAAARAGEAEAEAALRQARRQIERAVVKSPLDGIVLKVLRRPGELVDGTPATPVLEVADTSLLELVADVPAQDLVRLSRDLPAITVFQALPGTRYEGTVSMVSPSVDRATGVGTVRVLLRGAATLPPVGLYGVARIETGRMTAVLRVPSVAVRNAVGSDGEVVVCGADGLAHVHKVQVPAVEDGFAEITSGIAAGDRVAVEPVLGLAEGDALEVVQ